MEPTKRIEQMTPASVRILSRGIEQALKDLSDRHGVGITVGQAETINRYAVNLRLGIVVLGRDGEVDHAKLFVQHAKSLGLSPADLDTTVVVFNNKPYTIVGLRAQGSRDIMLTDPDTGVTYDLPAEIVAMYKKIGRSQES